MRIVVEEEQNQRIDFYLANRLNYSRSRIQKMLKECKILVNDEKVKSSYLVNKGDIVLVEEESVDFDIKPQQVDFEVVYEDEQLIVINKPNGLVVHPGSGNWDYTLVNGLMYYFNSLSDKKSIRPGLVHRLDANTTGLLVVAKDDLIHDYLSRQIIENKMMRKYYALVWGVINNDTGTIDAPIGRDSKNRQKYTVTSINSKKSITHFKVLKRYKDVTLLEVTLETGRTHQIRVHFNYIKHPVVNDPVYGKKKKIDDSGQCLHAKTLSFKHPKTNKQIVFDSELPNCFVNILKEFSEE